MQHDHIISDVYSVPGNNERVQFEAEPSGENGEDLPAGIATFYSYLSFNDVSLQLFLHCHALTVLCLNAALLKPCIYVRVYVERERERPLCLFC